SAQAARSRAPRNAIAIAAHGLQERAAHEIETLRFACRRLADLSGVQAAREPLAVFGAGDVYCVPIDTLLLEQARALGIAGADDFWGGAVPHAFVATKLVSHPRWLAASFVPEGWKDLPGIRSCTLPGFSTFSRADALAAGAFLLREGAVRLKSPHARGGRGQLVVRAPAMLADALATWSDEALAQGLVLERDLVQACTWSIGSSLINGRGICYHGHQHDTRDR